MKSDTVYREILALKKLQYLYKEFHVFSLKDKAKFPCWLNENNGGIGIEVTSCYLKDGSSAPKNKVHYSLRRVNASTPVEKQINTNSKEKEGNAELINHLSNHAKYRTLVRNKIINNEKKYSIDSTNNIKHMYLYIYVEPFADINDIKAITFLHKKSAFERIYFDLNDTIIRYDYSISKVISSKKINSYDLTKAMNESKCYKRNTAVSKDTSNERKKKMNARKISEKNMFEKFPQIKDVILVDHSSSQNIIWGTDMYKKFGDKYNEKDYITSELLFVDGKKIVLPRIKKTKLEQNKRSKEKAEVFTPSWICNKQNNLIDNEWFGKEDVFNKEQDGNTWVSKKKIVIPKDKKWEDYVLLDRIEITCGEAPYLTSRYDNVNGKEIDFENRIGLLDRKIKLICQNVKEEEEWFSWMMKAYQSVYGYDYQGDNILIARENLLLTFFDAYFYSFNNLPSEKQILEILNIITWNIWQMDGLKYVIPNSCGLKEDLQLTIFDEPNLKPCEGCEKGNNFKHNGIYCYIMDWKENIKIRFVDLSKGGI